jgi:hypothetical protein
LFNGTVATGAIMTSPASALHGLDPSSDAAPPSVFISFSDADLKWKERVAGVLRSRGIGAWDAIDSTHVAVLLISPSYLSSKSPLGGGASGNEFAYLLAQRKSLFAVLVEDCAWQQVSWLSGIQMFPADGRPLSALDFAEAESYLALAALEIGRLAGVPSATKIASAKVSEPGGRFLGMATLVNQNAAIGVLSERTKAGILNVGSLRLRISSSVLGSPSGWVYRRSTPDTFEAE